MTDVDTRINNLKEDVRLIGVSTAEALSRLDKIQNTLSAHSAKLAQHDSRLDRIEARLDGHDRRFDQIDRRFDRIDGQLAEILARLPQRPQ